MGFNSVFKGLKVWFSGVFECVLSLGV